MPESINEKSKDVSSAPESGTREDKSGSGKRPSSSKTQMPPKASTASSKSKNSR